MGDVQPLIRPVTAGEPAKARILLVDDDERNLLALSEVLDELAEVVTVTSGREALRALLKGDFAVILLDVFMPGMDGYETAGLIRERDQTARIPIIFLSAVNKETEHLMRGYAMGAVDYVFKPVDPLILKSKVSVFVDLYAMRAQVEEKSRAEQALLDAALQANSEKLLAERELRLAEQRQAAIVTSLPLVLYLEPLEYQPRRPSFVSGNLAAVTGYELASVHGEDEFWENRIHPDDRQRVLAAIEERSRTGSWSVQYRWQCSDGSFRHFHDQAVLLPGLDGAQAEYAGSLADISDRRELEIQLIQAQKMDAIGQLTGGIAHDFNNLLSSVLGGLHLLERRIELGERDKLIVDQMRHAAEQGAELVRRMMAFARKQDLAPTSVDPAQLCQSVAGLVAPTLGGTVTVDWACPDTKSCLFVDQSQMELALVNLILNARDAMPGGGTVEVRIEEIQQDEPLAQGETHYLRICVSDHGQGIAPELVDRITEPFFTTKEAGKGTGLGLSMVVGFVQQSGGKLMIDSEQGKGTTVEVLLPSTPQPAAVKPAAKPRGTPSTLGVKSVLLVDDDLAVRTVLGEQLRDLGVDVEAVGDGASAIDLLKANGADYDLLLSDFAMPGMNGVETILSALKERPQMRTVLLTGYADEDALAAIRESIPVLRKPVDMSELRRALA